MNLSKYFRLQNIAVTRFICAACDIQLMACSCPISSDLRAFTGFRVCECGCEAAYVWPVHLNRPHPNDYQYFIGGTVPTTEDEVTCVACDSLIDVYDTGNVETLRNGSQCWCDGCIERNAEQCEQCDRYFPTHEGRVGSINRGRWNTVEMCDGCQRDLDIVECGQCASMTDADNRCHEEHDSDHCDCEDCLESSGTIHSYSYRPEFVFHGDKFRERKNRFGEAYDATTYMGFELEVECARQGYLHETAGKVQRELGDFVFLKSDSSIDYGFEIVSHPATLDYWLKNFKWSAIRQLRKSDITTSDSCGLHVHVSRNGFDGPAHEYRWLLFWYRNEKIMKALAHRDADHFAPFDPSHRRGFRDTATKGTPATGHYAAINSEGEWTYEVRIFASTLYVNRLKASLGLVAATVEYTRELRAKKVMDDGGMKWPSFVAWLKPRTAQYPHLMEEIVKYVKPAMSRRTDTTTFVAPVLPGDWRTRQSLLTGGYYGGLDTQYRRTTVVTQEDYGLSSDQSTVTVAELMDVLNNNR